MSRLLGWLRDRSARRLARAGRYRGILARAERAEHGSVGRLELLALGAAACMRAGEVGEAERLIGEVCGRVDSADDPGRRYVKLYCRHLLAITRNDEAQLHQITAAAAKLRAPRTLRRKLPFQTPKFRARVPPGRGFQAFARRAGLAPPNRPRLLIARANSVQRA